MTREQFLQGLGLTQDEFQDLAQKFMDFYDLLNESQRNAVRSSMPTIAAAARSFGPRVTVKQFGEILLELLTALEFVVLGDHCFKKARNTRSAVATPRSKPKKSK